MGLQDSDTPDRSLSTAPDQPVDIAGPASAVLARRSPAGSCGYDRCIVNLTFHHVDPSQKRFAMSMAVGRSIAAFREEAKKCVLVCANCHGEIEAGLIESPPAGAKFKARLKLPDR